VRPLFALLPLTLVFAACAGSGEPAPLSGPPPLDPTGVYDCTMSAEEWTMNAVLTISEAEGDYTASISTEQGASEVDQFTVDGNQVTFWVTPDPRMSIYFDLEFEGDALTGTMDGGEFWAEFSGKKR
jgi:hypothetical protein